MRKTRVHNWMVVLGVLEILSLTGCDLSVQEAAQAGIFDFVAGTITDSLTAAVPIADTIANAIGNGVG